jgi:hypothetical protein
MTNNDGGERKVAINIVPVRPKAPPSEWKRALLQKANEFAAMPDSERTSDNVKRLISAAEVVFCVFHDVSEPDGVGHRVVKGQGRLVETADGGAQEQVRQIVIPCQNLEEANALQKLLGEADSSQS